MNLCQLEEFCLRLLALVETSKLQSSVWDMAALVLPGCLLWRYICEMRLVLKGPRKTADLTHGDDTKVLWKAIYMCRADFCVEVSVVLGLEVLHVTLGGMVCSEDNFCTQPFISQLMINTDSLETRASVELSSYPTIFSQN